MQTPTAQGQMEWLCWVFHSYQWSQWSASRLIGRMTPSLGQAFLDSEGIWCELFGSTSFAQICEKELG
jgi:hypothetical protein